MSDRHTADLIAEDLAFLRRWVESGVPPLTVDLGCEQRLTDAGFVQRVLSQLQVTDAGRRYIGSSASPGSV